MIVECVTLAEVMQRCTVDEQTKSLLYQYPGNRKSRTVSVVYFRAGYTPNDYPTDVERQARVLIESSRSIKCPTVGYQLAGSKKVQQVLSEAGVLEKYLSKGSVDSSSVREVFASKCPSRDRTIK